MSKHSARRRRCDARSMWTLLPCNSGDRPSAREMGITLDAALEKVNAHLKACPFTSKDRIDLEALEKHCGRRYAQPETVPAEIWSSLRAMHGIDCVVLLPPDSADSGRTSVGSDGIICLSDSFAALKGLPVNTCAKALLTACGRTREIQGDVFVGRVAAEWGKDNTLRGSMGGETPPQVRTLFHRTCPPLYIPFATHPSAPSFLALQLLVERDWLEKAQRYSSSAALEKAPGASAFESMLLSHLQLIRQQDIAAAIAEAKAKAAREGGGPTTGGPSEEALHGAGAGTLSWTDGKTDITVTVLVPASTK